MTRRLAALAIAAIAAGAVAAPAQAAFPGRNGRIAFVRPGEGIYTVNPDGSARRRVSLAGATGARCDSAPSFSPSGLELAFQTCDPARHATAVGVMGVAGEDRRMLARDGRSVASPQTPAFGPGGGRIAFAAGASTSRLFSVRIDGSRRRRIGATGYAPAWSRAGIAYTVPFEPRRWCSATQLDDVFALDATLHDARRLTKNHGSYAADWAPDGRHVVYTRDYSVRSDEGKRVRHTPMDCKPVLRAASRYGPEIVVAKASGKSGRRLTNLGGSEPAWSPDGRLIAFEREGYVYVMTADGHDARRVAKGSEPSWQPLP
jgi:Tol biopolymer transport system component